MVEKQLITKIIEEKQWPSNLKTAWFKTDKSIATFIIKHLKEHGQIPAKETITQFYPDFEFIAAPEPLDFYVTELQNQVRYTTMVDTLEHVRDVMIKYGTKAMKKLPQQLISQMQELLFEFNTAKVADAGNNALERLEKYASGEVEFGISSSLHELDGRTSGWKSGQLIVITGRPKRGKTWLATKFAVEAFKQGYKTLFITLEMTTEEILGRFDAFYLGISPTAIRNRDLLVTPEIREKAAQLEKRRNQFVVVEDAYTLAEVQGYIQQYDPDICFVDAVYLMQDGNPKDQDWRRMAEISRSMKKMAKRFNKPIVITSQLNRQGDVAYSDAFRQDADVLMSLNQTEELRAMDQQILRIDAIRDGRAGEILLNWDIANANISEVTEADAWDFTDDFVDNPEAVGVE